MFLLVWSCLVSALARSWEEEKGGEKEEKLGDPVMWCVHVLFFIENLKNKAHNDTDWRFYLVFRISNVAKTANL